jgi:hypothetical protein
MDTGMAREGCPMREWDTLIARKAGKSGGRSASCASSGSSRWPTRRARGEHTGGVADATSQKSGHGGRIRRPAHSSGCHLGNRRRGRLATQTSGHTSDVTDNAIREIALPLGLVDVKVAAVDDVWSGLKIVWRVKIARNADAPTSARRASA